MKLENENLKIENRELLLKIDELIKEKINLEKGQNEKRDKTTPREIYNRDIPKIRVLPPPEPTTKTIKKSEIPQYQRNIQPELERKYESYKKNPELDLKITAILKKCKN